jgi:hypothetical protein
VSSRPRMKFSHGKKATMIEGPDAYAERVRQDHAAHRMALLAISGWAWSIFDWAIALVTFAATILAILLTNRIILLLSGSLAAIKVSRWGWVAVAFVVVTVMSVQVVR